MMYKLLSTIFFCESHHNHLAINGNTSTIEGTTLSNPEINEEKYEI
jgi:hypothetical protein